MANATPRDTRAGFDAVSSDLNRIGEGVGDLGREREHQVPIERLGHAGEGIDPVACTAPFLESGDRRLGRPHPLGQLALGKAGFGAQVVDQLAEVEVLLDPCPRLGRRCALAVLDVFPSE